MSIHGTGSPTKFHDITPSDTEVLDRNVIAILAGIGGDLVLEDRFGNTATAKVVDSQVLICSPKYIKTTSTATNLVAFYDS